MNLVEIKTLVEREIEQKTMHSISSLLSIYSPVYHKGKLVIDRIDNEKPTHVVTAYLPVEERDFYFAMSIDTEAQKVISFDIEGHHQVFFRATSIFHRADHLQSLTSLSPTIIWSKGDKNPNGNFDYFFSAFTIEINNEADELEDKIEKLLNILEGDNQGILSLSKESKTFVKIISKYSPHDDEITTFTLTKEMLDRLSKLHLEVDYQIMIQQASNELNNEPDV